MMVDPELLKERRDRILKAVALEKPDRIPMVLEYSGFAANATKTEIADFISSPSKATETMIQAYKLIGGGDVRSTMVLFRRIACAISTAQK
jgi:uroporphyrinogen-III decarboxylase